MRAAKRMRSFFIALLMAVGLLTALTTSGRADTSLVEQAQYSIVRVVCSQRGGEYVAGTGFAVGEPGTAASIFVTSDHVVADNTSGVYITITDWNGRIPARVLYQDSERDIAILSISSPLSERQPLYLLSPSEISKTQDIYCLGFPGLADSFSESGSSLNSTVNDITITKGAASNPTYSAGGVSYILADVTVNPGNSGGPMVDEYGQAIGINAMVITDDAAAGNSMTLAVSIDHVMDALDSLGLPYAVGSADGSGNIGLNTPSATDAPSSTQAPHETKWTYGSGSDSTGASGGLSGAVIAAAAGVAVVVAVVLAVIILSRRRRASVPPAYPARDVPPAAAYPERVDDPAFSAPAMYGAPEHAAAPGRPAESGIKRKAAAHAFRGDDNG